MFCAFNGSPKIVRLHGHGTVLTPAQAQFQELAARFPANAGTRAIVHIVVNRVSTSCGYSVPFLEFRASRETLDQWAANKGPKGLSDYRAIKNQSSIDGLPAFNRDESSC
jgi:hypothetical protein